MGGRTNPLFLINFNRGPPLVGGRPYPLILMGVGISVRCTGDQHRWRNIWWMRNKWERQTCLRVGPPARHRSRITDHIQHKQGSQGNYSLVFKYISFIVTITIHTSLPCMPILQKKPRSHQTVVVVAVRSSNGSKRRSGREFSRATVQPQPPVHLQALVFARRNHQEVVIVKRGSTSCNCCCSRSSC